MLGTLFAAFVSGSAAAPPASTPYRSQGPLEIRSVEALTPGRLPRYARFEVRVRLNGTYDNPFDSSDARLDATVTTPSGRRVAVPGFFTRPYARSTGRLVFPIAVSSTEAVSSGKAATEQTVEDGERLTPAGEPEWRIRYAPTEVGLHRMDLSFRTRQGLVRRAGPTFRATPATGGFVRVSPKDPRFFALDDGTPFWPLGSNLGWAGPRGLKDFEDWIPRYGAVGANWGRVWLSPHWTTFALERPGSASEGAGLGVFDLGNAWRLDQALEIARKNRMRIAVCIDSYNILRDQVSWPEWERSPHNRANGGPLAQPGDFWTDPEMDRLYCDKLRYLVARYGANTAVMAWETWNEVDGIADYQPARVRAWQARVSKFLAQIDPNRLLRTTSFGGSGEAAQDREAFAADGVDYVQSHRYGDPDVAAGVARAQARLGGLAKPHFVGEIGADSSGSQAEKDPKGYQIHDPLWASVAVGAAGGAMPWWWDSYIHPRDLYGRFGAVARFVAGIDWPSERFKQVEPRLEFAVAPKNPPKKNLDFEALSIGWKPAPFNRPQTLRIDRRGVLNPQVLSAMRQGLGNHPELHNPLTFETDLPWPTSLAVDVGDVSGYGGAALKVVQDGKTVLEEAYPDPDGDVSTDTLKQFAGIRSVPIPASKHRTTVSNTGKDWLIAGFRLVGAVPTVAPPLVAWATVGDSTAVAWVRHEDRTWRRIALEGATFAPAPASRLVLAGLKPGGWQVELWDTWKGQAVSRKRATVGRDGVIRIPLPALEHDLAVKCRRVEGRSRP